MQRVGDSDYWALTVRIEDLSEAVISYFFIPDWDNERISLSLKATLENPWDKAPEKYEVGTIHTGKVSRLAQFGAFVTLEPGVDGLLHISKLGAGRRIDHPREVLEQGQEITVRIDKVDSEKKRISLVPDDFVDKKESPDDVEEAYTPPVESSSLGTLGDLLSKTMKQKK